MPLFFMKKFLVLMISIVMMLSLASCSKSEAPSYDRKGKMLKYSLQEIYDKNYFGMYVMNKDGSFTPVMSDFSGYEDNRSGLAKVKGVDPTEGIYFGKSNNISSSFWWVDSEVDGTDVNHERLVPTIRDGSKLVAIYKTTDDIPKEFILEKFTPLGWTIGGRVGLGVDKTSMYIGTGTYAENSSFRSVAEEFKDEDVLKIAKINESKNLPLQNVDEDVDILRGLEKNKYYKFTVYFGTFNTDFTVKADTKAFKEVEEIALTDPIKETENQYFEIQLPANATEGYYMLNGEGVFRVE